MLFQHFKCSDKDKILIQSLIAITLSKIIFFALMTVFCWTWRPVGGSTCFGTCQKHVFRACIFNIYSIIMSTQNDPNDLYNVYSGSLKNIPDIASNVVRVFLSSTFTGNTSNFEPFDCQVLLVVHQWPVKTYVSDFAEERNIIHRDAVPELRKHCNSRNLDLQARVINNSPYVLRMVKVSL